MHFTIEVLFNIKIHLSHGFLYFRLRYGCIKPVKSMYACVTVCQVNVLKGVCTPTSRYRYHKHGFGYCLIISSLMISLRHIYIYLFIFDIWWWNRRFQTALCKGFILTVPFLSGNPFDKPFYLLEKNNNLFTLWNQTGIFYCEFWSWQIITKFVFYLIFF